jgi:TolB-like protein/DNA-binding winged helix-turn-helix (wHTH) protein/Tfp pilus assembly protein PilF
MATPNPYQTIVRFGVYELDLQAGVLRKNGMRIRCQEQPLQVLAALLDRPGELITREELRKRVWPEDTFVDFDHALNTAVKKIRAALNDDADFPRYIETVPRRGYRFIAPVTEEPNQPLAVVEAPIVAAGPAATQSTQEGEHLQEEPFQLRWLMVSLVVAAFAGGFYYMNAHRTRASVVEKPLHVILAVLPFQNMTSDVTQESFSDGMTEETISQLGRVNSRRFAVIARTSAMKYKNAQKSVQEIGRELHADYVLEGSIRREGTRVRVATQLVRAEDQSPRWSREFDYGSGEALNIESEVASEITAQVESILGDPAAPTHLARMSSHDAYLRGLADSSIHTPEGLNRIIETFQDAARDNPDSAESYAGLAHIYERGANLGFLPPKDAYAKARQAAQHAIQIDANLPESHAYLADALLTIDYDWKGAQSEIEKALALNENDPMAHEWNGTFLAIQGKFPQGINEMSRAVELDPVNADRITFLAELYECAGKHEEAEIKAKSAIQLDPASDMAHGILLEVYEHQQGREDQAMNEWTTLFELHGERETAQKLRKIYEKSGYKTASRAALREHLAHLVKARAKRYVSPYTFARIYATLGDKEQTLTWLQEAYEQRDVYMANLPLEQNMCFKFVKNEQRFQDILKKVSNPT